MSLRAFPMARLTVFSMLGLLLAACGPSEMKSETGGNPAQGKIALTQYACHACHIIPGITGSKVFVGPPLDGLARRSVIAGQLPNTPANLTAWIRNPHSIDSATAMPDLGVSETHARDMVAYLSTLK